MQCAAWRADTGVVRTDLLPWAAVPLLPALTLAAVEWQVARARRRAAADPVAAWFGLAIGIQWTVLGFWAAWALVCLGPAVRAVLAGALSPELTGPVALALYVVTALVLSAGVQSRVAAAGRAIRSAEATPGRTIRRVLGPLIAVLAGLIVLEAGPTLIARGFAPVPLLLGGILLALGGLFLMQTPVADAAPNAVTAGEMRDRIVALAARAGISVRQLYVMPRSRERLANAFASNQGAVLVTDYLLAHLGRDEVDAVMAHELAHLRRRDPQRLAAALLGVSLLSVAAWYLTGSVPATGAAFAAGAAAFFAFCRRLEYGADAGALQLGARADALVSGLVRVARLNHVPPRWGRGLEWTLTHPSLERRARALVARGALDAERARDLLADPRPAPDRYAIPAALAGGAKVFSSAAKAGFRARAGWGLLLLSVAAPAIALRVGAAAGAPHPALAALALAAGVGTTIAASLALGRFPMRGLRSRLAARLAERGVGALAEEGSYVGLAPGSDTRVIEGFYVWDLGFLRLSPGHLDYAGEETSFTLIASRVERLDLVSGPPAWRRTRCVRITWTDPEGSPRTLRLFAVEPGAGRDRGREVEALFDALDAWRRGGTPSAARLSFEPPRHHEVTSITPREQVQPSALVTGTLLQTALAAAVCAALGLPLAPWAGAGFPEVLAAAVISNVALLLPSLRHREPARVEKRSPEAAAAA